MTTKQKLPAVLDYNVHGIQNHIEVLRNEIEYLLYHAELHGPSDMGGVYTTIAHLKHRIYESYQRMCKIDPKMETWFRLKYKDWQKLLDENDYGVDW